MESDRVSVQVIPVASVETPSKRGRPPKTVPPIPLNREEIEDNFEMTSAVMKSVPGLTIDTRKDIIKEYHQGAESLVAKVKTSGIEGIEELLSSLIDELIQETDHLLGNELIAVQQGFVRDSSVISFKRAEIIEKAIKAVQTKQVFDRDSGIDVDSPYLVVTFKYFLEQTKNSMDKMNLSAEMKDLFFKTFSLLVADWRKDLKAKFKELKELREQNLAELRNKGVGKKQIIEVPEG